MHQQDCEHTVRHYCDRQQQFMFLMELTWQCNRAGHSIGSALGSTASKLRLSDISTKLQNFGKHMLCKPARYAKEGRCAIPLCTAKGELGQDGAEVSLDWKGG